MSKFLANHYNTHGEIEKMKALNDCINAIPTDGLGITDSDLDQLGAKSYYEVDEALIEYLKNKNVLNSTVVNRHISSDFKKNPYSITRNILES